jgi:hypothetical protein
MDKAKLLYMLERETPYDMSRTTLYGIEVSEFKTVEELTILAYWALVKWQQEMDSHG